MDEVDHLVVAGRTPPGVTSMVGYRSAPDPARVHLGLPSSRLVFIVSRDDGVCVDGLPANPVVLGGMHTAASIIRTPVTQAGVQLSVHPLASRALFGRPAADLDVSTFSGLDQLGRRAERLHQRMTETGDWATSFDLLQADLMSTWNPDLLPRPEIVRAWQLLEQGLSVAATARGVGFSERRLQTLFRSEFGCSPRTIAQLMRFERTTAQIRASVADGAEGFLADVAARAGYADQAHLTREFRRFAGVTPGSWVREEFGNVQAADVIRGEPSRV
jgi:AraC-like DNA-binding protein